jgi:uncharacterized NAD(P)/FAD-binding protein YdhS
LPITDHPQSLEIAIIGGGFCGILTAIHLMQADNVFVHIHIVNKGNPIARGVAYAPNHTNLVLNVPNGKMSAFADFPDHYVNWLTDRSKNGVIDKAVLAKDYSTREQYGEYLTSLWKSALKSKGNNILVSEYDDFADDLIEENQRLMVRLRHHPVLFVDKVILATGNEPPTTPDYLPGWLMDSERYISNPWKKTCIENVSSTGDILIIGNGLTMTDTVISLTESGFKGTIYTISPHGYRLQPATEAKLPYNTQLSINQSQMPGLPELFSFLNKHRKIAASLNQSFYPVIDALRPHLQLLWQSFNRSEKQQFITHVRPVWEIIRHRLPPAAFEYLNKLIAVDKLITNKGGIQTVTENDGMLEVQMMSSGKLTYLKVQRIINCTGPALDITKTENLLLKNLFDKGTICPSSFHLGIKTDSRCGCVINSKNEVQPNIAVIGCHLKGTFWESTAVTELRLQAKNMAAQILSGIKSPAAYFNIAG